MPDRERADVGVLGAPGPGRRALLAAVVRSVLVVTVSTACFALAPLDREPRAGLVAQLAIWLGLLGVVYALQIRAVIRSPYPALRAFEAVAVGVPLLVYLFAAVHFITAQVDPASFTEPLGRVDAVYFSVTVLATVGFGDIAPVTRDREVARHHADGRRPRPARRLRAGAPGRRPATTADAGADDRRSGGGAGPAGVTVVHHRGAVLECAGG